MQSDGFGSDDYTVMIPIMYDVVLDELNCFEIRDSPMQVYTIVVSIFVSLLNAYI
jgi:hypothetical protein